MNLPRDGTRKCLMFIDAEDVLPFVPAFPCAESFVTFTFSQQLPSLSFHLLLSLITFLFASPDEPFAAALPEPHRFRDDQRTQSRSGTPVSFPVGPGSNRILQLRSTLWTASKSTDDFSKWLS